MIDNLKRKLYTSIAEWKYRKHDYDEVCCCGSNLAPINIFPTRGDSFVHYKCTDYCCPSRCAKEYAVTCYVESKMNKEK